MTVVIGYGNPLRGDDGAGPKVAAAVGAVLPELEVLTPQQLTPELAATLARADLVVFIDAAVGDTPGTVSCDPVRCGEGAWADHALSPSALLRLTRDAYGLEPPAWLVRIHGQGFGLGAELSAPVVRALPRAIERVHALVRSD